MVIAPVADAEGGFSVRTKINQLVTDVNNLVAAGIGPPPVDPPVVTDTFYVDPVGGSDAAAGTEVAPWLTMAGLATVVDGATVLLKRGTTLASNIVLPTSVGITIGAYGSDSTRPIVSGKGSVKGVSGDWTSIATNRWSRAFTDATGSKYVLISNGLFTKWRHATSAEVVTTGDWYIGGGALVVFSVGNPATTFTTLEVSGSAIGVEATAATDYTIENIEVIGFVAGMHHGQGARINNTFVHKCASYGNLFTLPDVGGVGNFVYDCGNETYFSTTDIDSFGMWFKPAADTVIMTGTFTDTVVDNTRDDCVKSSGAHADSLIIFDSTVPGKTRFTRSGHDENILDNQAGHFEVHGAYIAQSDDPLYPVTSKKHSTVHCYGEGNDLYDCAVNGRNVAASGESYYAYVRRGNGYLRATRCVLTGMGVTEPVSIRDTGSTSRIIASFLYGGGVPMRMEGGKYDVLNSTFIGTTGGLITARTNSNFITGATFARSTSFPGGLYTYTMGYTSNKLGIGARIEIAGLTGASAALNGIWTILTVPTSTSATFQVPAALNPPSVVDKTGGTIIQSVPSVLTMDGNHIAANSNPLIVQRAFHLTAASYGKNSLHDVTGAANLANLDFNIRTGVASGASQNFTAAQITATAAVAGNLSYDTVGKLGGTGWVADDIDIETIKYWSVVSASISSGIATFNVVGHPFTAPGQKVFILGATPSELTGGQFIKAVTDANNFTIDAERGVVGPVTGTIKVSNMQLRDGSPALGTGPVSAELAAYTLTDLQGTMFPASGRNFGAVQ